ncbi:hypothetical protein LINPERPRIM_LOCUS35417 [Linum perenne]
MAPKGWCLHVLQSFVIRKLFVGISCFHVIMVPKIIFVFSCR